MKPNDVRPSDSPAVEASPGPATDDLIAMASTSAPRSADCCPASPRFRIVLPATPTVRRGELYLCGHHLHTHALALLCAGATVFDAAGHLV